MKAKRFLKVLAASALLLGTVGLATSCGEKDNNGTTNVSGLILQQDSKTIVADFTLPSAYLGCDLTWTSSNTSIISVETGAEGVITAKVTRPAETTDVTLTATSGKYTKNFTVRVTAIDVFEIADNYSFEHDKKSLATGSYDLATETEYKGKRATITWSIADTYASLAKIEDGKLVVTGTPDKSSVTIQATFTYNNETSIKKYTFNAFDNPEKTDIVTGIEVGVPYLLYMAQGNTGNDLFFSGEMSGYYGATTTDKALAVKVTFEQATGGYYLTFTDSSSAKKYINVVQSGTYINFKIEDAASSVWTWNAEYNTPVTVLGDKTYYIGTYKTYETISPSTIDKAATSFPIHLSPVTSVVTTPETGVLYDFVMMREEPVYFTGEMSGYYGKTTAKVSESLPISLEAVSGGYNITYNTSDSQKKYINAVVSGKYVNFKLEDAATSVWTWDETKNTLVTVVNDTTMYVGLDSTHDTIGIYKADKVAFPLQLKIHYSNILVDGENTTPETPEIPSTPDTPALPEGAVSANVTYNAPTDTVEIVWGTDVSSFFTFPAGVVASAVVNQGSNPGTSTKFYTASARIYKGAELVITAAEGYTFSALEITYDGDKYGNGVITISEDGKTITISAANNQIRIKAMALSYVAE